MLRRSLLAIVIAVIAVTVILCYRHTADKEIDVTHLLRRSDTTKWREYVSTHQGLKLEIPTDLCTIGDEFPSLGFGIGLHRLPPPPGIPGDTRCLLSVQMQRMSPERFQEERATDHLPRQGGPHKEYRQWTSRRHDSIDRWDTEQGMTYRYDVECPNGDMVWTLANVRQIYEKGVSLYAKEDDAIVRRILGSVRCLDRASASPARPQR